MALRVFLCVLHLYTVHSDATYDHVAFLLPRFFFEFEYISTDDWSAPFYRLTKVVRATKPVGVRIQSCLDVLALTREYSWSTNPIEILDQGRFVPIKSAARLFSLVFYMIHPVFNEYNLSRSRLALLL